jgi:hypothetical protein
VGGLVIGHGGSKIKELSDRCKCKVAISDSRGEHSHTHERVVTISGTSIEDVVWGAQSVTETFHQDEANRGYSNVTTMYSRGAGAGPGPGPGYDNRDMRSQHAAPSYNGIGYPPPFNQQQQQQQQYYPAASGSDGRGRGDESSRGRPGYGNQGTETQRPGDADYYSRSGGAAAAAPVYYGQQQQQQQRGDSRGQYGAPGGGGAYGQGSGLRIPNPAETASATAAAMQFGVTIGNRFMGENGSIVVVIGVPDEKMGLVIGKRGAVLQDIISQTGARLQVRGRKDRLIEVVF